MKRKAGEVLHEISERFNAQRAKNKTLAYRGLQRDLMDNAEHLVPDVMSFKELLDKVADLEEYLKDAGGETGKSPLEMCAEFLNGAKAHGNPPVQ